MNDLNKKSFGGLISLTLALAALLFIPAGTFDYWQAWVFLCVFFVSTLLITVYLIKNDPELLERRINARPGAEKEKRQKVILITGVDGVYRVVHSFSARSSFWVVSNADLRRCRRKCFGGPWAVCRFFVFKENSYASATIEVGAAQKVISTGPYAIVRHPMYAVMLFGVPLALGSRWGLLAVVPIVAAIVLRLLDEKKFLAKNLAGYLEYQKR